MGVNHVIDEPIVSLIKNAPNLIIAIWVIWRGEKVVVTLLENQRWMIEQLMALSPPQEKPSNQTDKTVEKTNEKQTKS